MLFARIDARGAEDPGFGCTEHLLLWSLRRIVLGQVDSPLIAGEFVETYGEEGSEVFAMLRVFVHALGAASARKLQFGHPGDFTLTRDEQHMLTMVAAAQADDDALLDASLDRFARSDLRHVMRIASNGLAKALAINSPALSLPLAPVDATCPQALAS